VFPAGIIRDPALCTNSWSPIIHDFHRALSVEQAGSGIKTRDSFKLFVQPAFFRRNLLGHDDLQANILIASATFAFIQTLAAKAQSLTGLRTGRYSHFNLAIDRWHFHARPKYRLPGRYRQLDFKVVAEYFEKGMGTKPDVQI
jgi:hypothetical protein